MLANSEMQNFLNNSQENKSYSAKDGLLYWKDRLVIPGQSPLIQEVSREYHSSPIGGHAGIALTIARVTAQFYWPRLKEDVKAFVQIVPFSNKQRLPTRYLQVYYNPCLYQHKFGRM